MKPGDVVLCGGINMSFYKLDGTWEPRWFTGKEGVVVKLCDGVHPVSYEVNVGKEAILIEESELKLLRPAAPKKIGNCSNCAHAKQYEQDGSKGPDIDKGICLTCSRCDNWEKEE